LSFGYLYGDQSEKVAELIAFDTFSINENRGSAPDSYSPALLPVFLDKRPVDRGFGCGLVLIHIQPDLLGKRINLGVIEAFVISEQGFVKCRKFALVLGGHGTHRGFKGEAVIGKRELLDDYFQIMGILFQQLPEKRFKSRAVRSLVVIEDNEGDFGLFYAHVWPVGNIDSIDLVVFNNL
jgi:hypothetical protein